MSNYYTHKTIISGNHIEVYEFDYPVVKGFKRKNSTLPSKRKPPEQIKKSRIDSLSRTKKNLKRLIFANADLDKFITLTFKENIKDVAKANNIFHRFIDRLKTHKGNDLKYIVVIEFQKRGAIHFHCLMNLPYVENKELRNIWKYGFVRINKVKKSNVASYLLKYIVKDQGDSRLVGKRRYLHSNNIKNPIEQTGKSHEDIWGFIMMKKYIDIDTAKPEWGKIITDPTGRKINYKIFTGNDTLQEPKNF